MKIDYKKLLNMFKDKYDEISHFNKHDYEIYKEYLYQFDKLIDDEIEFAKLAHKFEDSVNDAFSDRYCLALMFTLEELGLLDTIENGRIEEKSIKESINGDCYIYYDDDDNKRLVFCDYVKGITDTSDWFYLNEYIIDAIHIFKNEKQAQKFIDEHLKYFADQDKVVIAEYPQTVGGFFESKKSSRKSIKESKVMSYDEFKKIVKKEFTKDEIEGFGKTDNGYGVYVIAYGEKEIEIMCDDLRQYGFECKWWHSSDPEDDEPIYFIEAIPTMNESKKSARKSIKESSDVADKIASEIDKSYWIDKLIDDLDRHYESMEKAWLKNLDKLSDEDILDIVDDCMGKSKTLVGKSEMLKNKMINDLSKAYDDYIDDIDRQIRIGKSEDEVKEMIETTLENDIKIYLKLAYNNKASSNYFMVKFAEDNLI